MSSQVLPIEYFIPVSTDDLINAVACDTSTTTFNRATLHEQAVKSARDRFAPRPFHAASVGGCRMRRCANWSGVWIGGASPVLTRRVSRSRQSAVDGWSGTQQPAVAGYSDTQRTEYRRSVSRGRQRNNGTTTASGKHRTSVDLTAISGI